MKKTKNKRSLVKKSVTKTPIEKSCCNINSSWSWSIYVYWFIILFFIAATFYILGRSHEFLTNRSVKVAEETLMQANDYVNDAKIKIQAGNIDEAITDLDAAIEANSVSDNYILRGEAYMQMGNYQNALKDFDLAIEKDGTNAVAFYDRSLLNTRLENYTAALNDINNALAVQSTNPSDILTMRNLYAKRGQLNLWLKNWAGAVADYTNSLARAEGEISASVYAERAEAYTAIGEYTNALNDYTSAIRVISEQIQAVTSEEDRETMSNEAMSYYEKSAALNLKLGSQDNAKIDLESAYSIATALNDTVSVERIENLIKDLN